VSVPNSSPSRGIRISLGARARCAIALLCAATLPACLTLNFEGGMGPLEESRVAGTGRAKIVLIEIEGTLSEQRSSSGGLLSRAGESSVARVREQLDRARKDTAVRALLLRIDSPGGTATASEIIYSELLRFKRERDVPIVAHFMGTAASGAYYVAMAADEIIALPTTVTGSIGVLFFGVSAAGLMEKIGIENQTLVSHPSKDATSMLRRMSDSERAHLQSIVDSLDARFRVVVGAGRPELAGSGLDAVADGRIFSAEQALEAGLIDRIASIDVAIERARALAEVKTAQVVIYHRPGEWRANVYSRAVTAQSPSSLLPSWLAGGPSAGFHYLWLPAAP
jgi:protease-4